MTITETDIAAFLESQGLGKLRSWRCTEQDEGSASFIINGEWVLQASAGEPNSGAQRKQAAIYRLLRGEVAVPVPGVLALDTSHTLLPYDLLLLERLEGRPAVEIWPMLDANSQEQLSYELGRALAMLHTVACTGYGGFNRASETLGGSDNWRTYLLDKAAESLLELWQREGLPTLLLYGVEDYLLRAAIPLQPRSSLVHGDFGLHNVLLTRDRHSWRLSGVLNFEWALAAAAEYEFATGLLVEPDEINPLTGSFIHGYRSLRGLPSGWQQHSMVYRLVYHLALCAVVWRLYEGDAAMLRYHRSMIVDILKAG